MNKRVNRGKRIYQRAIALAAVMALIIVASTRMRADTGTCGGVTTTLPFTDVMGNTFFCQIASAYFSGLTNGTDATHYSPAQNVTREQMAAFITRTQDSALKRSSQRASAGQWWTPKDVGVLRETPVGDFPSFNCFDGEDIWVAGWISDTVTRVHASDGRVLGTWTGADSAYSTIAAAGFIYVTGRRDPGRLYRIDPAQPPGAVTEVENNLGSTPVSITFDGLNLWTANHGGGSGVGSITRYNIVTDTETTFGAGFDRPVGIVFDGTHLWVVDAEADALHRVNPANGTILETLDLGSIDSSFFAIPAFDGSNIWVPILNGLKVVSTSTPAKVLATLKGNGLSSHNPAVAFDGERIMVTVNNPPALSLWKATSLTPLGSLNLGDNYSPVGVCSDGLHFWITTVGSLLRF
jgi:hypothetical protein